MNTKLLINGKFVTGAGDKEDVLDPATGKPIVKVGEASEGQIDNAVKAARNAFGTWSATVPKDRAALLLKLADRIAKRMRLLLPPNVQKLEAAQSGEPPPPPQPPAPPTPEQQLQAQEMGIKQKELELQLQEINGRAQLEQLKLQTEQVKAQTAMLEAQTELKKAQLANQGIELGHAAKMEQTATQSAAKTQQTELQHAARMEQTETAAAAKMQQTELAHVAKMEQLRAKPAPQSGGDVG